MSIPREVQRDRGILTLLSLGVAFTFIDIYTSVLLWHQNYIEANPIMDYVFTYWGLLGFVIINLFLSALLLSFLSWASIYRLEGKSRYLPLLIYCVLRGIVVVNNSLLLL